MKNVDLAQYQKFVEAVTSLESNNFGAFQSKLEILANTGIGQGQNVNVPLLITAAIGMGSESGEFQEIVKKVLFQGKPLTEDTVFHMKRELGDLIWYWINGCRALGFDPNDVIAENVEKLKARYPGGAFDVYYSENRKTGDL